MTAPAAIILAAGGASRFGAPKQLADLHGRPLLQHVVDHVEQVAELRDMIVVLGANADAVIAGVRLDGARIVRCADWADGMAASLRAGVAALPHGTHRAVVLLGDQPLITPAVIRLVLEAATAAPEADAVRAAYDGVPGHPVHLGPRLLAQVPQLRGDTGARDLLAGADVRLVEAAAHGDGTDIDTPEQLEKIAR